MKRIDDGKVSLVEFLSSIKFSRSRSNKKASDAGKRVASFEQRAPVSQPFATEDSYLIRSAN